MRRILITGASGFVGSNLILRLKDDILITPSHDELDLTDQEQTNRQISLLEPDIVVHLAGLVGGIKDNSERPADFLYENLMSGMNLINACKSLYASKILLVGTICSYPRSNDLLIERELWNGRPEESNAPYGLAKRMVIEALYSYMKQYQRLRGICLLPSNLYGPGNETDPNRAHVIGALVRKFVEAVEEGRTFLSIWGNGAAERDFLFIDDFCDAIISAMGSDYSDMMPINIGCGSSTSIACVVEHLANMTGFRGEITYSGDFMGQDQKIPQIEKAERCLGFRAKTSLREGLEKTVQWYKSSRRLINA